MLIKEEDRKGTTSNVATTFVSDFMAYLRKGFGSLNPFKLLNKLDQPHSASVIGRTFNAACLSP
ncbi:hypothetical protein T4B_8570 [Trichinella pseudospiralis]|uniref:Uncharacterized protein n=1 Tax=Trichinella pseudospiralis TaxID=6337 RepID=A0A0V1IA16_TRIPS|nr:hypothetical protein T4B_8570 [Trichinella pseudospiralis]